MRVAIPGPDARDVLTMLSHIILTHLGYHNCIQTQEKLNIQS